MKIIIPKPRLAASFIRVVGSEFVQKYLGEGPRMVRDVFRLARENAPAIIFIDEIDAIATKRFDAQTGGEYLSSYFAHTRLCGVCRWAHTGKLCNNSSSPQVPLLQTVAFTDYSLVFIKSVPATFIYEE